MSNVPFLEDRRKAHVLNLMYLRKKKVHLLNNRDIRTRAHDAPLFNVSVPRCETYRRSVSYSGGTAWNNLSPEALNEDCYLAFKYHQKKNMYMPLQLLNL